MIEFTLCREKGLDYILICNNRVIHRESFIQEWCALEYFHNYVSDWQGSTLILDFDAMEVK